MEQQQQKQQQQQQQQQQQTTKVVYNITSLTSSFYTLNIPFISLHLHSLSLTLTHTHTHTHTQLRRRTALPSELAVGRDRPRSEPQIPITRETLIVEGT